MHLRRPLMIANGVSAPEKSLEIINHDIQGMDCCGGTAPCVWPRRRARGHRGQLRGQDYRRHVELCDSQSDSAMANAAVNFCSGFAQGTVSLEMEHDAGSRSMKLFCLPDPAPTRNEALAEFVKWARASPERLNATAVDGLISFLGERYPCPKRR